MFKVLLVLMMLIFSASAVFASIPDDLDEWKENWDGNSFEEQPIDDPIDDDQGVPRDTSHPSWLEGEQRALVAQRLYEKVVGDDVKLTDEEYVLWAVERGLMRERFGHLREYRPVSQAKQAQLEYQALYDMKPQYLMIEID